MIVINIDVMLAKRKMSVSELSEKVGFTMANVSLLKNGKIRALKISTLDKLCRVLECQPADLLEYVENGEYYFSGTPGKIKNAPPEEREDAAFLFDVETCYYEGITYALQRIYYISTGNEYHRGIYLKDGKFDEIHKDWSKK